MEARARMNYKIGVDLGQARDFTAAAILECPRRWSEVSPATPVHLLHCERIPLGTSYVEVVECVRDALFPRLRRYAEDAHTRLPPKLRAADPRVTLIVDHSGVGRPVVDLFRHARLQPVAVTITNGVDVSGDESSGYRVPLVDLVDGLALAVRAPAILTISSQLHDLAHLLEEFQTFERRLTKAGHETFGNFREYTHDDQLFAIAIGLWHARHGYETMTQRVFGV
jgi:hypothetical protein